MQNQDTVFQQVWSVCVHLTPQFLQKLTVAGRSYSRTTRYPVCHDHTFTIVRENHHLFHIRLGPHEFFRSRGTFACAKVQQSVQQLLHIFREGNECLQKVVAIDETLIRDFKPELKSQSSEWRLTGLRFQFRLEIPDPGFVNSNHLLQTFVPFTKSVQQLLCNFQTSTLLFLTEVMRNPPDGNSTFVQAFSQNAAGRCSRNFSRMCNFFTSFCGLPPGFGAHVPHFGHQSTFGVVLTSGRSLCLTSSHESAEPSVKLCFGQQFPHHTLPSGNCGSPLEFSRVMFKF